MTALRIPGNVRRVSVPRSTWTDAAIASAVRECCDAVDPGTGEDALYSPERCRARPWGDAGARIWIRNARVEIRWNADEIIVRRRGGAGRRGPGAALFNGLADRFGYTAPEA